jgi:hypothetical protein
VDAVETLARCRHPDLALLRAELVAQPRDPVADPVESQVSQRGQVLGHVAELADELRVAEVAVAGSPLRLNATARAILPVAFSPQRRERKPRSVPPKGPGLLDR